MSNLKCCPDPCEVTPGCVNPLIHLMKRAISRANDGYTLDSSFLYVLVNGIHISGASNYCCPDCVDEKGFYILGGINAFEIVMYDEKMNIGNPLYPNSSAIKYPCCVNKSLPLSLVTDYEQLFLLKNEETGVVLMDKRPTCCNNDFSAIVDKVLKETESDELINYELGIIEGSSFNGISGITIILDYLNSISPEVTKNVKTNIINIILTKGIVIKCQDCDMFIGAAIPNRYNA